MIVESKYDFFGEESPFLHHPLLTDERAAMEIDFVQRVTGLQAPALVLDVGCGFGRHSVELAQRGFETVGVDPSGAMLDAARARAASAGAAIDWRQGDGQTFSSSRAFDAAICLFTTLGQVSESGDNVALLANVYGLLKPGACLTVETPQRDAVVAGLKPEERLGGGERSTVIRRSYDSSSLRLTERFEISDGAQKRHFMLCFRLFSREELSDLIEAAGFSIAAIYAGYDRRTLTEAASTIESTMIFVAQK